MSEKIVIVSGKRKTAVARATATNGNGKVLINDVPLEILQPSIARMKIQEPILVLGNEFSNKVDVDVKIEGGGFMAQAEAARVVVSNALSEFLGDSVRKKFLEYDRRMLVDDPRRTEPKKFGGHSARRRKQKSYR
ncbi:MAG TPA: 30S ribosomal protein S9 [Candidatus Methanomethylicus sp.]|jgi:small subunit ribosomal protein S9|nr:30S ribosomal protein S9 [Candidatus Methanomethylicus sp.]HRR53757.1 30S ribosomal protein S9 [Candidatus Methanomethylicus sp.]